MHNYCPASSEHNNWWGAKYCGQCGTRLREIKRHCAACAHEVGERDAYCTYCGQWRMVVKDVVAEGVDVAH